MYQVKIISDGSAIGTHVKLGKEELPNVTKIAIDKILPGNLVNATISLENVDLDMLIGSEIVLEGGVEDDDPEQHF